MAVQDDASAAAAAMAAESLEFAKYVSGAEVLGIDYGAAGAKEAGAQDGKKEDKVEAGAGGDAAETEEEAAAREAEELARESETEVEAAAREAEELARESETEEEAAAREAEAAKAAKGIPAMQKRIDEITAARRTAEEERDTLKAEVAALKAAKPEPAIVPTADNPLADVTDVTALQERIHGAAQMKAWATAHWDGGALPDGKGGEQDFSAEQVRQIFTNADALLTHWGPQRADYLAKFAEAETATTARFPKLTDKTSEEAQLAAAIVGQLPELRRFPNWKMALGHLVTGLIADREAAKKAAEAEKSGDKGAKKEAIPTALKAVEKEPIAPASPGRSEGGARVPVNAGRAKAQRMEKIVAERGSADSLAAAFASEM